MIFIKYGLIVILDVTFHKREKVTNLLDQPFRMSEKFQNKIKKTKNNSSEIL
jgi:hypothetical protein